MPPTLRVWTLFEAHQQHMGLEWVAGHAGRERELHQPDDATGRSAALIGYMNCIHTNRIQVLGPSEMDYLGKLGKNSFHDFITHLFDHEPAAIVITDGVTPSPEIKRRAEDTGTPLWSAHAPAHEIIDRFAYFLKKAFAQHVIMHGVFMEIVGIGILITGASGIGKSELALDLLSRGHRLIADDAPEFYLSDPEHVMGTCPNVLRDFLEVRGLGVLNIRAMFGESAVKQSERLQLVVHLVKMSEDELSKTERLGMGAQTCPILGVNVPQVTLPVTPGRNLSVVVECAARNRILLNQGYNALEAFTAQQRSVMELSNP